MSRLLSAIVLAAVLTLTGTACSGTPGTGTTPSTTGASASNGAVASSSVDPGAVPGTGAPGSAAPTGATSTGGAVSGAAASVCAEARQAIGGVITTVAEQLGKVNGGSAEAVQKAVEAVNTKLGQAAATFQQFASRNVPPSVKSAFEQAGTELREIASPSYAGTPAETQQRLARLVVAIQRACTG